MVETGIDFGDFAGVQRYAMMLVDAGMVPLNKDEKSEMPPDGLRKMLIARATIQIIQGRRIGLTPEQSVTSIYVVNGRPTLFGDTPLAVCRQHALWEESGFSEWYEVNGTRIEGSPTIGGKERLEKIATLNVRACCTTLRKGSLKPRLSTFSIEDAVAAGLFGKGGNLYVLYTWRMLRFRARGYGLRDDFGDALKGIGIKELHTNVYGEPEEETPTPPAPSAKDKLNGSASGSGAPTQDQAPVDRPPQEKATVPAEPPNPAASAEKVEPVNRLPKEEPKQESKSTDKGKKADKPSKSEPALITHEQHETLVALGKRLKYKEDGSTWRVVLSKLEPVPPVFAKMTQAQAAELIQRLTDEADATGATETVPAGRQPGDDDPEGLFQD
jgi:outer membrane biosynthesis protein TonB